MWETRIGHQYSQKINKQLFISLKTKLLISALLVSNPVKEDSPRKREEGERKNKRQPPDTAERLKNSKTEVSSNIEHFIQYKMNRDEGMSRMKTRSTPNKESKCTHFKYQPKVLLRKN